MTDRILLIGAGNMGGAMLKGWLAAGRDPASVMVVSPSLRTMPQGVAVVPTVPESGDGEGFGTIVLAVKPQKLDAVRGGPLADHAPRLLVSVLAGVEGDVLATLSSASHVARIMPNLPVAIGRGVSLLWADTPDPRVREDVEALARPLGTVEWIDDAGLFDAATALSGCGPGFTFRFVDALAEAGARLGLDPEQARRLAIATVEGSALMAAGSAESPAVLADRVASPGGSTREGLNVLDRDGALLALMEATLAASTARNRAMAEAARG